jgi:hypothetical protein
MEKRSIKGNERFLENPVDEGVSEGDPKDK